MTASERAGEPLIEIKDLCKSYGSVIAVDGLNLSVSEGEVFGLLGPNGAGKTTTFEILEGFRKRDAGSVRVLGVDPEKAETAWRAQIGVVFQTCGLQPRLTVEELLALYGGFYPTPRSIEETIRLTGLDEIRRRRAQRLSGGEQRRLDVALALIGNPRLLFLDEPTTGFDPSARRAAWEMIRGLSATGTTIVLSTHYMEEAQALCDRVGILSGGRLLAEGRPEELVTGDGVLTEVRFMLVEGEPKLASLPDLGIDTWQSLPGGARTHTRRPLPLVAALHEWALANAVEVRLLEVAPPSLEETYLSLTGEGSDAK
ncbi:MAG TPA: ABC transporter ATP-binding protein [Solirubrobacteraceae bacterium]|jgi:ABC-2 type transport system ATP-binding protein